MGKIENSLKLLVQPCKNCEHLGSSHRKPIDDPQGRLRHKPLVETFFTTCNECQCHKFEP